MSEAETAAVAAIREAGRDVLHNLRELALFEVPGRPYIHPPSDVLAERSVLEALLCGRRRPAGLACSAADFYSPALGAVAAVVEALEETGTLDGRPSRSTIIGVLRLQGAGPERAAVLLSKIIKDEPMRADVDELAEHVRELAQRRRAIRRMLQLDASWRAGADVDPSAVGELRDLLSRWST